MNITGIYLSALVAIEFPIVGAVPSVPYIVKAVDGLGASDVDLFLSPTIEQGDIYQGRRPQNREIVMRVGLNPNYVGGQTVGDLRDALYSFMSPGDTDLVTVSLINGDVIAAMTEGYIKRIEMAAFTKDPEVQITIVCPKPFLHAQVPVNVYGLGVPSIEINNVGTAPAGFYCSVNITAAATSFKIQTSNGAKKLMVTYPFVNGDQIRFNTQPGERAVQLVRNNVLTDLISGVSEDSTWLQLHGGVNPLSLTATPNASAWTWSSFLYVPQYWGI